MSGVTREKTEEGTNIRKSFSAKNRTFFWTKAARKNNRETAQIFDQSIYIYIYRAKTDFRKFIHPEQHWQSVRAPMKSHI